MLRRVAPGVFAWPQLEENRLGDTSVRLLSAAMGWAAERSAVGGDSSGEGGEVEIFNIDNGDVASWEVSRASSIHAVQPASC